MLLLEAGPPQHQSVAAHPARLRQAVHQHALTTGATRPSHQPECHGRNIIAPRGKTLGGLNWIERADLHPWPGSRTSITGVSSATPAGAIRTYCRTSAKPRTTSAAPTSIMAPVAAQRVRTCATSIRLAQAFIDAAAQCGYPRNDDFNGAAQEGAGLLPDHHERRACATSTTAAYLKPERSRV